MSVRVSVCVSVCECVCGCDCECVCVCSCVCVCVVCYLCILQQCQIVCLRFTNRMEAGLQSYADHIKLQQQAAADCEVDDPRSDEEKQFALSLAELLRSRKPPPIDGTR